MEGLGSRFKSHERKKELKILDIKPKTLIQNIK